MIKRIFDFFFGEKEDKKENIEEEVSLDGLKTWLEENTKEILEEFWSKTNPKLDEMEETIVGIEESLKGLKVVDLSNKSLDQRSMEIISSNRDSYIEQLKRLLDILKKERKIRERGFKDIEDIKKFSLLISSELDSFSKRSLKNFHISSTFIGKELEGVLKGLQGLSKIGKEIQNIDKSKVENIEELHRLLEEIEKEKNRANQLKGEKENLISDVDALDKKFLELKRKEEDIKKSDRWKEKEQLEGELFKASREKMTGEQGLVDLFLPIEKAIQKYSWKEKEKKTKKLLLDYLEDPFMTFKKDKELEILSCIQNIKIEIEEGRFEDKRKERLLEGIKNLTKEKIDMMLKKDLELEKVITKIKGELSKIGIEKLDFESINNKKEDIEKELENTQKKREDILKDLGNKQRDIERLSEKLGKKLKVIS
ncbi:hypothetical protein ACFLZZ_03340 [Nanoarchaeota archaeon]